jgi:hypothetical protein
MAITKCRFPGAAPAYTGIEQWVPGDAPEGVGPAGITMTPKGDIWFVSLTGPRLSPGLCYSDAKTQKGRRAGPSGTPTPRRPAKRCGGHEHERATALQRQG